MDNIILMLSGNFSSRNNLFGDAKKKKSESVWNIMDWKGKCSHAIFSLETSKPTILVEQEKS